MLFLASLIPVSVSSWTVYFHGTYASHLVPNNVNGVIDQSIVLVNNPDEQWQMFHHDPAHSGYSTSTAPNTNQTLWSYRTGPILKSSPAVADDILYIGAFLLSSSIPPVNSKVYAINASSGVPIWSYTTGGSIYSSPAVADGRVFIGSCDPGEFYALNATTGALIWSYQAGYSVFSDPVVAGGKVYVGSDNELYAFNVITGTKTWSYDFGMGGAVESSPAVASGIVYVGSDNHNVYALNATNGAYIWNYTTDTGFPVSSSPAVASGMVYVGDDESKVYALNATTGALVWSYKTGWSGPVIHPPFDWPVWSSPAVYDDKVFAGSQDHNVYALNASTGALVWNYTTGRAVASSPAVADGKVFVGSDDCKVYALNASTGALVWSYKTGDRVSSSPAVVGGRVFVGSEDGKVYAFGLPTYDVTIKAHCITESADVNVSIALDGSPTSYTTPHTFTVFAGTHTFTVLDSDANGDPFKQWSAGGTNSTITVSSGGIYTAYYRTPPVHAVAVTDVKPSKTVVGQAYSENITVTVLDLGDYAETLNITLHINDFSIASQNVTLSSGNSATVAFVWNTTGFAYGSYMISASVSAVPGETDTADNTLVGGRVTVSVPGDANGDGEVNVLDLIQVAAHLGHTNGDGHTLYSPEWYKCVNSDLNSDGQYNVLDLILCANHLGQHLP
jgi:outer membrane protein assembly factor BamB